MEKGDMLRGLLAGSCQWRGMRKVGVAGGREKDMKERREKWKMNGRRKSQDMKERQEK